MTNLENATINEGILLKNDYEELFLTKGVKVEITYADYIGEHHTIYGVIAEISDYDIKLENDDYIYFNDIIEIEKC